MKLNNLHITAIFCFIIAGILYLIGYTFFPAFLALGFVIEIIAWGLIFSGGLADKKPYNKK